MLASKGVDSEKMWKDVSRSLDCITDITSTINNKLNIHDIDGERNTNVDGEILKCRALLRYSNYLLANSSMDEAYNIYGELLSADMIIVIRKKGSRETRADRAVCLQYVAFRRILVPSPEPRA